MALDNNTALTFVENDSGTSVPTSPPNVTIISVDHSKISDESGINSATVKFTFDTDVTSWSVNVMGVSSDTGTIADSGGTVTAGTEITAIIDYTELYQEGYNKVNIYGQNSIGWTAYEEDPNAPKNSYYLQMNGTSNTLETPNMTFTKIEIDFTPIIISGSEYYYNASGSYYLYNNGDSELFDFSSTITINGNDYSFFGDNIKSNIRYDVVSVFNNPVLNNKLFIFSNGGSNFLKGNIYSVKVFNNDTLIAYYDMSTGTVQDQSGNGNHATLIGGTWVEQ